MDAIQQGYSRCLFATVNTEARIAEVETPKMLATH
jgi:hypothetical protein